MVTIFFADYENGLPVWTVCLRFVRFDVSYYELRLLCESRGKDKACARSTRDDAVASLRVGFCDVHESNIVGGPESLDIGKIAHHQIIHIEEVIVAIE